MRNALILTALATTILGGAGAAAAEVSLQTAPEILRYIARHPQDAALATYTAAPDGTPDPDDPVLFHNADVPMPLASVIKVVVLAAYAREVVAERLDSNEEITLGDWERFYLPRTDGGAHPRALASLGIPADAGGFALEPSTRVPLDTLARAMIRWSDNAATDYLLKRLGPAVLHATIVEAGLTGQEMPRPILGIFLSWYNHDEGSLTQGRLRELLAFSPAGHRARIKHFAAAYQNDFWREAEIRRWLEGKYIVQYPLEAQAAGTLFPAGTARDYARILAGVVTGTFLSPEISAVMRPPLERDLLGSTDFDSIGFKGGTLASVINEAAWFVPREGSFAGKPRIVVLFLRALPVLPWADLVQHAGQVVFAFRVARDRSFVERTQSRLAQPPAAATRATTCGAAQAFVDPRSGCSIQLRKISRKSSFDSR